MKTTVILGLFLAGALSGASSLTIDGGDHLVSFGGMFAAGSLLVAAGLFKRSPGR